MWHILYSDCASYVIIIMTSMQLKIEFIVQSFSKRNKFNVICHKFSPDYQLIDQVRTYDAVFGDRERNPPECSSFTKSL